MRFPRLVDRYAVSAACEPRPGRVLCCLSNVVWVSAVAFRRVVRPRLGAPAGARGAGWAECALLGARPVSIRVATGGSDCSWRGSVSVTVRECGSACNVAAVTDGIGAWLTPPGLMYIGKCLRLTLQAPDGESAAG